MTGSSDSPKADKTAVDDGRVAVAFGRETFEDDDTQVQRRPAPARPLPMQEPLAPAAPDPWAQTAEALLTQADACGHPAEATRLLIQVAEILELRLQNPAGALATLDLAFRQNPDAPELVAALEAYAARTGSFAALLELGQRMLLELGAPEQVAQLWAHLARWSRFAGRWSEAVTAAENALEIDGHHGGALLELEASYRHLGLHGPLSRVLVHRLRRDEARPLMSPHDRIALWLDLAALFEEKLGDQDQALACCERVLAVDANHTVALTRIERLAEARGRLDLLRQVLTNRLLVAPPGRERTELALRLAQVHNGSQDPAAAISLLCGIVKEGSEDPNVLAALSELYRQTGHAQGQTNALMRLFHTGPAAHERPGIMLQLGRLLATELGRPDDAEPFFEAVVLTSPGNDEAARGLAEIWRARRDWPRLADLWVRSGRAASELETKLEFLRAAAKLIQAQLRDPAWAQELRAEIQALCPTDEAAARTRTEHAVAAGDWSTVRAALELLLAHAPHLLPDAAARYHAWLCKAHDELGRPDLALQHAQQAAALAPQDRAYLEPLVARLLLAGHLATARPHLERLWTLLENENSDIQRAELAFNLGRARAATGDRGAARWAYEQAVLLTPTFAHALTALARLATDEGRWTQVVRWKQRLIHATFDEGDRTVLIIEIAAHQARELGDSESALRTLEDGLQVVPGSHRLLHALLDRYVDAGRFGSAVETLINLADIETTPVLAAKYLATAGQLAENKLGDPTEAIALWDRALDLAPTDLETFTRIDRVLTAQRSYKAQAHQYRKMIWRLRGHGDAKLRTAELSLWSGLGEILRTRLRDYSGAITAFEAVARLQPNEPQPRVILAELHEKMGPLNWPQSLEERRHLLGRARSLPEMAAHLHSIHTLAKRLGQPGRAFAAADALVWLDEATADERFYQRSHAYPVALPERGLTDGAWYKILPASADTRLSDFLSSLGRALLLARSGPPSRVGLPRLTTSEVEEIESTVLAQLLGQLSERLRLPRPHLRFQSALAGSGQLMGVRQKSHVCPTLVAGADLLRVRSKREMYFLAARKLLFMRPEFLVLWPGVVPTFGELDTAIRAARTLIGLPAAVGGTETPKVVTRYARFLAKILAAGDLERLSYNSEGLDADRLPAWIRAAFASANRVGLLVTGDLRICLELLSQQGLGPVTLTTFEQSRDLIAWSLSDEHAAVRREWGLPELKALETDQEKTQTRFRLVT